MLFDLQGKRRRVVQATYLSLAVLMGGGLVLFGIGSGASGGVFDIFSGGNGGGGNEVVEERVEKNEDRVKANPQAVAAHKELVRDYYSLAVAQASDQGVFPADAQDELRKASSNWKAYVAANKGEPDPSLARVALQVYDVSALNQPQEAVKVARVIAAQDESPAAYLQVVQYALLAGDKRIERLASLKAADLARNKQERKAVRDQLKQIKAQAIASQLQQEGAVQQQGAGQQSGGGQQQAPQKQGGQ
jgi:hypothetical protein